MASQLVDLGPAGLHFASRVASVQDQGGVRCDHFIVELGVIGNDDDQIGPLQVGCRQPQAP